MKNVTQISYVFCIRNLVKISRFLSYFWSHFHTFWEYFWKLILRLLLEGFLGGERRHVRGPRVLLYKAELQYKAAYKAGYCSCNGMTTVNTPSPSAGGFKGAPPMPPRSVDRAGGRSDGRSVGRSDARSVGRSDGRSVGRSDHLGTIFAHPGSILAHLGAILALPGYCAAVLKSHAQWRVIVIRTSPIQPQISSIFTFVAQESIDKVHVALIAKVDFIPFANIPLYTASASIGLPVSLRMSGLSWRPLC